VDNSFKVDTAEVKPNGKAPAVYVPNEETPNSFHASSSSSSSNMAEVYFSRSLNKPNGKAQALHILHEEAPVSFPASLSTLASAMAEALLSRYILVQFQNRIERTRLSFLMPLSGETQRGVSSYWWQGIQKDKLGTNWRRERQGRCSPFSCVEDKFIQRGKTSLHDTCTWKVYY